MKQFKISHFKAFGDHDFTINLDNGADKRPKHLLVFGANGSGKTSIQEALKYAFFHKVDPDLEKTNPLSPEEEKQQAIKNIRNRYRNKQGTEDFAIEVDGISIFDTKFSPDQYNVFIIKRSDLVETSSIQLQDILERITYKSPEILELLGSLDEEIKADVNKTLKNTFFSDARIDLDPSMRWRCNIKDTSHHIEQSEEISKEYNESIISLIILLLISKSIGLLKKKNKDNILILDDFVTSLDAANRIAISKHIITQLAEDFQLILLTHNISYYNLLTHIIKKDKKNSENWVKANLVCINSSHNFYLANDIQKAKNIEKEFEKSAKAPENCISIGNKIRQSFEAHLHELASIMMLGGMEDTKDILDALERSDTIYYKEGSSLQKLIAEIDQKVNNCHFPFTLGNSIESMVAAYRVKESKDIIDTLRELRLYQKVVMHPMSHGGGTVGWSEMEIKHALQLLKKLENCISSVQNSKF